MPYLFNEHDLYRFYDERSPFLRIAHITSVSKALLILEVGFPGGHGSSHERGSNFFSPDIQVAEGDVAEPECILCFEWHGAEPLVVNTIAENQMMKDHFYLLEQWRYVASSVGDKKLRYVGGVIIDEYINKMPFSMFDRLRFVTRRRKSLLTLRNYQGDFMGVDHSQSTTERVRMGDYANLTRTRKIIQEGKLWRDIRRKLKS